MALPAVPVIGGAASKVGGAIAGTKSKAAVSAATGGYVFGDATSSGSGSSGSGSSGSGSNGGDDPDDPFDDIDTETAMVLTGVAVFLFMVIAR